MIFDQATRCLMAALTASVLVCGGLTGGALAHDDHDEDSFQLSAVDRSRDPLSVIPSRSIQLSEAETRAGVVNIESIMPSLSRINSRYKVFSPQQFNYFVRNFHYPYRERFDLSKRKPPTQVVLHWTANSRPDIPLYTFSAFLRSSRNGRVVERANRYKNVSNYYLTGSLENEDGSRGAQLVKLTRGDLGSWGDIPRVTAYPTSEQWDDNKYDGRGALGIEIESPNFGVFYSNASQRDKLHNFLLLVLRERGVLNDFASLRQSPHWDDMLKLHGYLKSNIAKIDVDRRGGIALNYQHIDKLLKYLPDIDKGVYGEAKKMFSFVSGHGVVAREYNERMQRAKRYRDANYDKIDFTEAHAFIIAMDLLQSDLQYRGQDNLDDFNPYLASSRELIQPQVIAEQPRPAAPDFRLLPSGRRERVHGEY